MTPMILFRITLLRTLQRILHIEKYPCSFILGSEPSSYYIVLNLVHVWKLLPRMWDVVIFGAKRFVIQLRGISVSHNCFAQLDINISSDAYKGLSVNITGVHQFELSVSYRWVMILHQSVIGIRARNFSYILC